MDEDNACMILMEKKLSEVTAWKGCAMAQAEARVRSGSVRVEFVVDWFISKYFDFPLSISFHRCSIKMEKQKKTSSSSSQVCTISFKAVVRP
jgi:hypothetical protein